MSDHLVVSMDNGTQVPAVYLGTLAPLVIFMCYVNIIVVFVCFAEKWKIAQENYYLTPTVLHFGKKDY